MKRLRSGRQPECRIDQPSPCQGPREANGIVLPVRITDLGALQHFNQDLWSSPAAAVTEFKSRLENADAVLSVTPEHFRRYLPSS